MRVPHFMWFGYLRENYLLHEDPSPRTPYLLHDSQLLLCTYFTSCPYKTFMNIVYFMRPNHFNGRPVLHVPNLLLWSLTTSCIMPTFMCIVHFMNRDHLCASEPLHDKLSLLCILYTSWRWPTTVKLAHFMLTMYFDAHPPTSCVPGTFMAFLHFMSSPNLREGLELHVVSPPRWVLITSWP